MPKLIVGSWASGMPESMRNCWARLARASPRANVGGVVVEVGVLDAVEKGLDLVLRGLIRGVGPFGFRDDGR